MKRHQIRLLETIIDDFDLTDIEKDQVRQLIASTHMLENTNKSACRKIAILQVKHPDIYTDIMNDYTLKYGRYYLEDSNEQD